MGQFRPPRNVKWCSIRWDEQVEKQVGRPTERQHFIFSDHLYIFKAQLRFDELDEKVGTTSH